MFVLAMVLRRTPIFLANTPAELFPFVRNDGKLHRKIMNHDFPPFFLSSVTVPIWRRINVPLTIWRWFVAQVTDVRHLIDQSVFTSVLVVFGYTCDIAFNLITVDSY